MQVNVSMTHTNYSMGEEEEEQTGFHAFPMRRMTSVIWCSVTLHFTWPSGFATACPTREESVHWLSSIYTHTQTQWYLSKDQPAELLRLYCLYLCPGSSLVWVARGPPTAPPHRAALWCPLSSGISSGLLGPAQEWLQLNDCVKHSFIMFFPAGSRYSNHISEKWIHSTTPAAH